MAAMCTPRRGARPPLRPVTPMGQDLPEDTPSKIRARNAVECASIRRRQEKEGVAAELETGLDLHAQLVKDRARVAEQAKADAALRRDLFARQTEHKRVTREQEAEVQKVENARQAEERKAAKAIKELRKRELGAEREDQRRIRAETVSHAKGAKAAAEARERELAAREYEAALAERLRKEGEMKAQRKAEMDERRAAILEVRELRAKERAVAAAALRAELEHAREVADAKDQDKRKAAEERRHALRARAGEYREVKELAKKSAYAR